MKIEELLKESESGFDSKNITNKGIGKVTTNIINDIESEGVTSESLESFPFPIFKYRTQITLHGIFETERDYFYTGGYKNLIVNKNKSLGVKYSAIDVEKKRTIQNCLKFQSFWASNRDSQKFSIYALMEYNAENIEFMRDKFSKIPDIFIGYKQLYKSSSMYGTFIVIDITLNAIYQANLWPFISALMGKEFTESVYNSAKEQRERESSAYWQKVNAEYAEKRAKECELFKLDSDSFFQNNKVSFIHKFGEGRFLFLANESGKPVLHALHIWQVRKGLLMEYAQRIDDIKDVPQTNKKHHNRRKISDIRLKKINERLTKDFYFKPLLGN